MFRVVVDEYREDGVTEVAEEDSEVEVEEGGTSLITMMITPAATMVTIVSEVLQTLPSYNTHTVTTSTIATIAKLE